MTPDDLAAIQFAHKDCLWCRTVPAGRAAAEGCSVARLITEVERLRASRDANRQGWADTLIERDALRAAVEAVRALPVVESPEFVNGHVTGAYREGATAQRDATIRALDAAPEATGPRTFVHHQDGTWTEAAAPGVTP
jgi:hypothetical protein